MAVSRERVLEALERGWGEYGAAYDHLSAEDQSEFVHRQGYERFADVLAHVIAWWNEGRLLITAFLNDPRYKPGERDVESFNAKAVEAFAGSSEDDVRRVFEEARKSMIAFVLELPPEAFESERVMALLNSEIVDHLAEHSLSDY